MDTSKIAACKKQRSALREKFRKDCAKLAEIYGISYFQAVHIVMDAIVREDTGIPYNTPWFPGLAETLLPSTEALVEKHLNKEPKPVKQTPSVSAFDNVDYILKGKWKGVVFEDTMKLGSYIHASYVKDHGYKPVNPNLKLQYCPGNNSYKLVVAKPKKSVTVIKDEAANPVGTLKWWCIGHYTDKAENLAKGNVLVTDAKGKMYWMMPNEMVFGQIKSELGLQAPGGWVLVKVPNMDMFQLLKV